MKNLKLSKQWTAFAVFVLLLPSSLAPLNAASAGSALSFDGTNGYVQIGASAIPVPWTATFWVKRQDSPDVSAQLWNDAAGALKLEQYNATRRVGFTIFGVDDYSFNYIAPAGVWTHLAFIGTASGIALYANGVAVGTNSATMSLPLARLGNTGDRLKGFVDEVAVWSKALTPFEVLANMSVHLAGNTPGLAGYWRFDEGASTVARDSSPLARNGMLTNNITWVVSDAPVGGAGNAFSFESNDPFNPWGNIQPSDAIQQAVSTNYDSFTIEFWARPTLGQQIVPLGPIPQNALPQKFVLFPDQPGIDSFKATVGISVATNGIVIFEYSRFGNEGHSTITVLTNYTSITNWTHVAVVYESRWPRLYVNGDYIRHGFVPPDSFIFTPSIRPSASIGGPPQGSQAPLGYFGFGPFTSFDGDLDEVRIWNYVRSARSIRSSLRTPLRGNEPGLLVYYRFNEGTTLPTDRVVNSSPVGGTGTATAMRTVSSAPIGRPYLEAVVPASGEAGEVVEVFGGNFDPDAPKNFVSFGGVRATVLSATNHSLTVRVPPGAVSGPVRMASGGLTAESPASFIVSYTSDGSRTQSVFAAAVEFPATAPGSMAAVLGDWSGDGRLDLAICKSNAPVVSFFRSTSTFGSNNFAPSSFTVVTSPSGLATADVDGDGRLDLISVSSTSSNVSVLRNTITSNNAIVFQARVNFPTGVPTPSGSFTTVVAGDVDGDGQQDLVVFYPESAHVSLLRNTHQALTLGTNSFAAPVVLNLSVPYAFNRKLRLRDIDGDGKPDLILCGASGAGMIGVCRNVSVSGALNTSSFAPPVPLPYAALDLVVEDFNVDGRPDLLFANATGARVLLNSSTNGAVSFGSPIIVSTEPALAVAAMNLEGVAKFDACVATASGVALYRSEVSGATAIGVGGNDMATVSFTALGTPRSIPATAFDYDALLVGDMDNDGAPDLVLRKAFNPTTPQFYVLRNQSGGLAPEVKTLEATDLAFTSATLNGFADANQLPGLAWFEYRGGGVTNRTTPLALAATDKVNVYANISNLGPYPYTFRVVASNALGVTVGPDRRIISTLASATLNNSVLNYTENAGSSLVDAAFQLLAPVGATYSNATIVIQNYQPGGESLGLQSQVAGITATWNPATGTLTLTGNASSASYEQAFRQVVFNNSSDNPDARDRVITFSITSVLDSTPIALGGRTIHVIPLNDPPTITGPTGLPSGILPNVDTPFVFTVADRDTPLDSLSVRASSTPALPVANLRIVGSGATRTIFVRPTTPTNALTVFLFVGDAQVTNFTSFSLTVLPVPIAGPASITSLLNGSYQGSGSHIEVRDVAHVSNFTLDGANYTPGSLTLSATRGNFLWSLFPVSLTGITNLNGTLRAMGTFDFNPAGIVGWGKQVMALDIDANGIRLVGGEFVIPSPGYAGNSGLGFGPTTLKITNSPSKGPSFFASTAVSIPGIGGGGSPPCLVEPPRLDFEGSLEIVNGKLNTLLVSVENINLPLGNTGCYFHGFDAGVAGLQTKNPYILLGAQINLGCPIEISGISLPGKLSEPPVSMVVTGDFYFNGNFKLGGETKLFGTDIGQKAGMQFLRPDRVTFDYCSTKPISLFLQFETCGRLEFRENYFAGRIHGALKVPDYIPVIGNKQFADAQADITKTYLGGSVSVTVGTIPRFCIPPICLDLSGAPYPCGAAFWDKDNWCTTKYRKCFDEICSPKTDIKLKAGFKWYYKDGRVVSSLAGASTGEPKAFAPNQWDHPARLAALAAAAGSGGPALEAEQASFMENWMSLGKYSTVSGGSGKAFKASLIVSNNPAVNFSIGANSPPVIFRLSYQNTNAAGYDLLLTLPGGPTLHYADGLQSGPGFTNVAGFSSTNPLAQEVYFFLSSPPAGTYTLTVSNAAVLGNFSLEAAGENVAPTVAVLSVLPVPGQSGVYGVNWDATDPDDNAAVEFYLVSKRGNKTGHLIATNSENTLVKTIDLNTVGAEIEAGEYYVMAAANDGHHESAFAWSLQTLLVMQTNLPSAPQQLSVAPGDGAFTVQWSAVTNQNIEGYTVVYSTNDDRGQFEFELSVPADQLKVTIPGLLNGQPYLVSVRARLQAETVVTPGPSGGQSKTNVVQRQSPIGSTARVVGSKGRGMTPPIIVSSPKTKIPAGQPFNYFPIHYDADDAPVKNAAASPFGPVATERGTRNSAASIYRWSLQRSPAGMQVDPESGLLTWEPGTAQVGTNEVVLRLTEAAFQDENGVLKPESVTEQSFSLVVAPPETAGTYFGESPAQFVTYPPLIVQEGATYDYQVVVFTPGNTNRLDLLTAPPGMTLNGNHLTWAVPDGAAGGPVVIQATLQDGTKLEQEFLLHVETAANRLPDPISIQYVIDRDGSVQVVWSGTGRTTVLQRSSVGTNGPWVNIGELQGAELVAKKSVDETPPTGAGYYRVVALDDTGNVVDQQSFVIHAAPEVITRAATQLAPTSVTLHGDVNPHLLVTGMKFEYGSSTSYGHETGVAQLGAVSQSIPLSVALTGLTPGATYHYRVWATNSANPTSPMVGQDFVVTLPTRPGIYFSGTHALPDGRVAWDFQGQPLTTYRIQSSGDLIVWADYVVAQADSNGSLTFVDELADSRRFFRAVTP